MRKGRVSRMLFVKCKREKKSVRNNISEINKKKKTLQNIEKKENEFKLKMQILDANR